MINYLTNFDSSIEIFSDASLSGWGACCKGQRVHGHWNKQEKKHHINILELMAVFFALKCFAKYLKNVDALMRVDNTTTLTYINKKGGVRFPKLSKLAKEIWEWCEKRNLWNFASYISSNDNAVADFESRRLEPDTEFSLSNEAFTYIISNFGEPDIDLFANRTNTKCRNSASWQKDPRAMAVNAFTIKWKPFFFYAFPPFSIILRILEKIRFERCRGILIISHWPAQLWFPIYFSMLESEPIYLKPNSNLLLSLNRQPHPLWERITLVARVLSGTLSK